VRQDRGRGSEGAGARRRERGPRRVDGFDDVVVGADLEGADLFRRGVDRGHEEDRDIGPGGIGLDASAVSKAIHARHDDIEEDEIGGSMSEDGEGIGALSATRRRWRPDRRLEKQGEIGGSIVDHETRAEGEASYGGGGESGFERLTKAAS